jgi:hypothetical protein
MRSSGSKRSWRLAVIMLLVLAALAIAVPAALANPGDGAIEGTVTAANGTAHPLVNISVEAISLADGTTYGPVLTDSLGKYSIDVPGGAGVTLYNQYYLKFYQDTTFLPNPDNPHWATTWWNGTINGLQDWLAVTPPAGATVVLVHSAEITVANLEMLHNNYLQGTVTDATGALSGIEVWIWYAGSGVSYGDMMQAVQLGDTSDLPDWIQNHMVTTNGSGVYQAFYLEPGAYKVYFHDPSGIHAPEWWDNVGIFGVPTDVILGTHAYYGGVDTPTIADAVLDLAGSAGGHLDGADPYDGHEKDMANVKVELWSWVYNVKLAETMTDSEGNYAFYGLPAGLYTVFVDAPVGYLDEWYNNKTSWLSANSFSVTAGVHTHGINMWIDLMPALESIVHPPFGVNDGPDRFDSVVTMALWGSPVVDDVYFTHQGSPAFTINNLAVYNDDGDYEVHLNLAAPLAPTGTYTLNISWWNPQTALYETVSYPNAYQVVNSYVPTPAPTPTAVPTAQPTAAPVPAPQPTVTPTVTPTPVAGAVTVTANKVTVKKGQRALLGFQVNEAVLGGNADVKIIVSSKAGKVVKQIVKRGVAMNAPASVSFTCKLAKGTYSYTVAAGTASATSTLIVK